MRSLLKTIRQGQKGYTLIEVLVVVVILGVLSAMVILNVLGLMHDGEEEARQSEMHNIRTAVLAMMVKAKVQQLDGSYVGVDDLVEVQGVTAGSSAYSLYDFLVGGDYPLKQAYDISLDGIVTLD